MKFTRLILEDGCRGWAYEEGEHSFTIEPKYAPENPNYRGYDVLHTGPRPDMARLRKLDGLPLDDDDTRINTKPIATIRLVKTQIQLLMKAINDANDQSADG